MYFYTGDSQGENTLEDTVQRNLTFPFLLNEGENCFLLKGLYHPIVKFLALGNMPPRTVAGGGGGGGGDTMTLLSKYICELQK